jgi:hypothetical protein
MSTPYVPKPLLGPDIVSGTISGLLVAANGVLTIDSTVTFLAAPPNIENTGRRVNLVDSPGHQEINAMNTRQRNQVIIDDGLNLDIQMYNVNNGTDTSPLTTLWYNYDYFYVVWTEGTETGGIYTNYFYGVRGDLDHPAEGRGEQLTTAHFLECDPGVQQYTRVRTG